jgi:hypothetical protein
MLCRICRVRLRSRTRKIEIARPPLRHAKERQMNTSFAAWHYGSRAILTLALVGAAGLGYAQSSAKAVKAVPQPKAPAMAPGAPGPGAPNPAGLPSPFPNPAGLTSRFPAGLPAPSTGFAGSTSPTDTTVGGPGTTTTQPPAADAANLPQATFVMGAGGAPSGPQYARSGPGPYTALQVAQSFLAADSNLDGELTRAEAQRLTIMPYSFEEMDRNRDGILSRFEYEDGVR